MDVAFCYESVIPARGGAETYIGDLARRLGRDGHALHLYAVKWDAAALPASTHYHRLDMPAGPRFLRPWRFGAAVEKALAGARHDVTVGFDKTWGQDVLVPLGGLHSASAFHNRLKFRHGWERSLAAVGKFFDLAAWSFHRLERKQYLGPDRPLVATNSRLVRSHFERFLGVAPESIRVVPAAIDPLRFAADDRPKRRQAERDSWGVTPDETVGLYVAMNYRLKGLAPLLHAVRAVPRGKPFRLVVVGNAKYREYERLAAQLGVGDRVKFLGFRADPKDAYFASDFLVHPTFYDPCSLVVLEALACGLPVITTRYNGAAEQMNPPADGLVIDDPHDAKALGAAMARMLDHGYRVSASQAARQSGNCWTFEHHYRAMLEVFGEMRRMKWAA